MYRLLHNSRYLRYFRDLRNGTIIIKGKARGDYVPFRRSLKSEDTVDLAMVCGTQVTVNNGGFLIELVLK